MGLPDATHNANKIYKVEFQLYITPYNKKQKIIMHSNFALFAYVAQFKIKILLY